MDKKNLFWYFIVPWTIIITLVISLSPWLFELLATPYDRVFSGINRWSDDYYIYLSYIEQGRRGFLPVKLLLTTVPHATIFSFLVYTIPGFIFGHIFGLSSVFIYHLFRFLYGAVFLWISIIFFYRLSKSKLITLIAFFLTFYVSGFVKITGLFPFQAIRYLSWLQEQNIIGRPTGPLHYSAGFIVFIAAFIYFFYSKAKPIKKTIVFGLLLNLLLLTNPFNYLIMGVSFGLWIIFVTLREVKIPFLNELGGAQRSEHAHRSEKSGIEPPEKKMTLERKDASEHLKNEFLTIICGFLLSLPLFLYLNHYLSTKPWGVIGVSPKFYVTTTLPIGFWEAVLSIGPIFFLGILGMIIYLLNGREDTSFPRLGMPSDSEGGPTGAEKDGIERPKSMHIFLIIWPTIQLFLLLFGDRFKIHPPRAFSGLYYLPLAYFSAVSIFFFIQKITKRLTINHYLLAIIIFITLFIITFPNYYLSYKDQLYAFTDFKTFSQFTYPTVKQVEAFKYLEKNSAFGSGVLAMFEASNQLMGFSGNSVELNMNHPTKLAFYANQMTEAQARNFLKTNRFQYVYWGPQEQSAGGNPEKYPFLRKIFENQEVKIYRVL